MCFYMKREVSSCCFIKNKKMDKFKYLIQLRQSPRNFVALLTAGRTCVSHRICLLCMCCAFFRGHLRRVRVGVRGMRACIAGSVVFELASQLFTPSDTDRVPHAMVL